MPKPKETVFITLRGKLNYAKVLGKPVDNYEKDGKEWRFDFIPLDEQEARARLKKVGIADRLKQKEDYLEGTPFLSLRQKATKKNGDPNDPISVVDVTGQPWPDNKLLGNETVADVKLRVADYGKGFKRGVYVNGLRILDLVPYNRPVFDEMDEDDPYNPKNQQQAVVDEEDEAEVETEDEEDDEVPFD
jgi:hypothetical protein